MRSVLDVDKDLVKVVLLLVVTKELSLVLDILENLVLKEGKCLYNVVCPSLVSRTSTEKITLELILDTLQALVDAKRIDGSIAIEQIVEFRLATKNDLVKILGRGKLTSPLKVTAHKFTATAKAAIEAAGGEAIEL